MSTKIAQGIANIKCSPGGYYQLAENLIRLYFFTSTQIDQFYSNGSVNLGILGSNEELQLNYAIEDSNVACSTAS